MYRYRAYGLTLASNRALPGLPGLTDVAPADGPDVVLDFADQWPAGQIPIAPNDAGWVRIPGPSGQDADRFSWSTLRTPTGTFHRLRYGAPGESLEFLINPGASHVWIAHQQPDWYNGAASIMLGQMMGCVLRLRGFTCLHASVVAVGQRAVAMLGVAKAGKSTFAAAAAQRGLAVLADDIAVLSEASAGAILAQPGYPHLRLGPATLDAFYAPRDGQLVEELRPVFSFSDKRFVDLNTAPARSWRFQAEPLPLVALYVLEPRQTGPVELAMRPLAPAPGLLALKAHSYVHFFLDQAMQAREFALLGRLARALPIRSVQRPEGLTYLPALCDAVIQDVTALLAQPAPATDPLVAAHPAEQKSS